MSTTTQILFNSPALHSLKRDQLVKLCKIHTLKANGKNVELIQRLRQHAQTLPKDSPLSIAARSDNFSEIEQHDSDEGGVEGNVSYRMPRPSEQWEVVMDSIAEVEENSQGTSSTQRTVNNNGTIGEFGMGSSRSTTVSSSIKALATSLGLKRNLSKSKPTPSTSASSRNSNLLVTEAKDELERNSIPYASLPSPSSSPQTDHFVLNPPRMSLDGEIEIPLPGHALRPGIPAPANARLSLGLGLGAPSTPARQNQPTTTIRLISNPFSNVDVSYGAGENGTPQLQPFKTTFDLILGSPTPSGVFGSMSTWPPRDPEDDIQMKSIYPALTVDDLPPSIVSVRSPQAMADRQEKDENIAMPGSLTPARSSINKSPEPFIFGSPLPQHNVSNAQFRIAATSVLEEMNKRLREEGVDEIQSDIIAKLHPGAKIHHSAVDCREIKPMPGAKRGEIKEKFQKLHESEFEKMEGIDALVKRRAERSPQKPSSEEEKVVGKKRKSGAIAKESPNVNGLEPRRPSAFAGRASSTRVISNGRRSKVVIPGAFGSEEDEEDEDTRSGKRARMEPEAQSSPLEEQKKSQQEIRLERENEAIRKKLEANRARRRSSAAHGGFQGRKSGRISAGRPSLLGKPKPKPSRFGFLSSAKSLVQSVWNRGKAPAPVAPSNIPKPTLVKANTSSKPVPAPTSKAKVGPPPLGPKMKSSIAPAHPTTAVASGSRIPSVRNTSSPDVKAEGKLVIPSSDAIGKGTSTSSSGSRSRSPLPSFDNTSASRNSLQSNAGTRTSRTSSVVGRPASRNGSLTGTGRLRNSGHPAGVSSIGTHASSTRMSSTGTVNSMGSKKTFGGASLASRTSSTGSSSRFSSMTSRLLAPTASSLAKANGRPSAGAGGLKAVSEDQQHPPLGTITNSSALHSPEISSANQSKIFSKPLLLPQQSAIPTPVKNRRIASSDSTTIARANSIQRSLTGRKPRISRSKVIARLASQRATSGNGNEASGNGVGLAPKGSNDTRGRTRSSLGAKASRASYGSGGTRSRASGGGRVTMSAKKRARQSEYARRKSKVAITPLVLDRRSAGAVPSGMDIDDSQ